MIEYITLSCVLVPHVLKIATTCLILFAKTCDSLRDVTHKYSIGEKRILALLYIISLYCTANLLRTALFCVITQNSTSQPKR